MKKITLLIFLVYSLGRTQTDCNTILTHGLRNISVSISSEATVARTYENHCNKDFESMSEEQLGAIEVEVFGYGGGGGSLSKSERAKKLKEWCKTNEQEYLSNKSSLEMSSKIYGRAYEAYERCLELEKKDINFDYQPSVDNKSINVSMQFNESVITKGLILSGVVAEGFKFEITHIRPDGKVKKYQKMPKNETLYIKNLATDISFVRDKAVREVINGQAYNRTPRGNIAIQTAGKSLAFYFPEEFDPIIPEAKAQQIESDLNKLDSKITALGIGGIGSITSSLLSEEKFQELYNGNGQEWVLAIGQSVPENSKYFEITGRAVLPDLRGVFLRGKNYTRPKSKGNTEGNLELGAYQEDIVGPHNHTFLNDLPVIIPTNKLPGQSGHNLQGGNKNRPVYTTDSTGERIGDETRPRNVTVNYFVRIN